MAITDWPAAERPREKLLARGAQARSDAELLAIFLRTGVAGKTAVDLARDLLARFGGLRSLLNADTESFCAAHGLGTAKYAQLQAVLEMARRHLHETLQRGDALTSPELTRRYLRLQLQRSTSIVSIACSRSSRSPTAPSTAPPCTPAKCCDAACITMPPP